MNSRVANNGAWERLFDLHPDIALLSEVNGRPEQLYGYKWYAETATGRHRTPQIFSTAILTTGQIGDPIHLRSGIDWVDQGFEVFPGNFVGRRVAMREAIFNVISVHMPSWTFPVSEFTDEKGREVAIPGYRPIYMSELLWGALRNLIPASDGDWIVGGDFNTSEFIGSTRKQNDANRTAIERLEQLGLVETVRRWNGRPVPSWLSSRESANRKHQLDHLYVSVGLCDRLRSAVIGFEAEFGTQFSDHLPIIADFRSIAR